MIGKGFVDDVDRFFGREHDADDTPQGSYGRFGAGEPDGPTLLQTARAFSVSHSKIRKSLITSGSYFSSTALRIQEMKRKGMKVEEIAEKEKLSIGSVYDYLPYEKSVYNVEECSPGARTVREWRDKEKKRKRAIEKYINTKKREDLIEALRLYIGARFKADKRFTIEMEEGEVVIGSMVYRADDVISSSDPYMVAIRERLCI